MFSPCWASLVQVKPKRKKKAKHRGRFGAPPTPIRPLIGSPLSPINANAQKRTLDAKRRASKRSARAKIAVAKKKANGRCENEKKDAPANVPSPRSEVLLLLLPLLRRRSRAEGGSAARLARAQSCICLQTCSLRTSTCVVLGRAFARGNRDEQNEGFFFFKVLLSSSFFFSSVVPADFENSSGPSSARARPLTSSRCASLHCPRCPGTERTVGLPSCGSIRR